MFMNFESRPDSDSVPVKEESNYFVSTGEDPRQEEGDSDTRSSPKTAMEQEKRIRREIANSNERRRMQSINAGFQSLRALLPHRQGEKLSKAAILQQTADFVYQLEQERTQLLAQNSQLKRLLGQQRSSEPDSPAAAADQPPAGPASGSELLELRLELEQERRLRSALEQQLTREPSGPAEPYKRARLEEPEPEQTLLVQQPAAHEILADLASSEPRVPLLTPATPAPAPAPVPTQPSAAAQSTVLPTQQTTLLTQQTTLPAQQTTLLTQQTPLPTQQTTLLTQQTALPTQQTALLTQQTALPAQQTTLLAQQTTLPAQQTTLVTHSVAPPQPLYLSRSRQNLETIVEAIRHLEGDHLFEDSRDGTELSSAEPEPQEAPLELTTHDRDPYRPAVIVPGTPGPA